MSRFRLSILAVLLGLVVAACAQPTPTPTTAPTKPAATTPAAAATTAPAATTPMAATTPTAAAKAATTPATTPMAATTPATTPMAAATPMAATTPAAKAATTPAAPAPTATPNPLATIKMADDQKYGVILTDTGGKTLYYFTNDRANITNCYDNCATSWPPLLVTSGQPIWPTGLPGVLGTITRRDGAQQVTYNGMPLYTYARDANVGDTTGHNVGSVWFVAKPGQLFVPEGQTALKVVNDPTLGQLLTDSNGWVLYYYTRDELNKSYCIGNCAKSWPPFVVAQGETKLPTGTMGTLGTFERADGTKMVTYNGMPLYYWWRDTKAGDTTGHLVGNVWYVVPPSDKPAANFPTTPATPAPAKPAATPAAAATPSPAAKSNTGY